VESEPQPPVEARAAVDRAVATTGDLITYRVTVDYDAAYGVEIPEPGAEIAGFRIIDLGREEPQRSEERIVEERWYRLRADLVGSYVLPPVTVSYRRSVEDGLSASESTEQAAVETVETSAIFVEVESVLPVDGGAEDIRDLKPLRRIGRGPPWVWIGAALGLVLLAAGVVALLRWWRREVVAPQVPPHELAFAALDALRGTDFSDPRAVRRFYFAISEVVRAYVEGRFGLNATDLTTEEILAGLSGLSELDGEASASLGRFLLDTDQVKFAHHGPTPAEIEATYEGALSFVETTGPAAPEQEAVAA
jgi:hypothetical protein